MFVIILFYLQKYIQCRRTFTACKRHTTEEAEATALMAHKTNPKTPLSWDQFLSIQPKKLGSSAQTSKTDTMVLSCQLQTLSPSKIPSRLYQDKNLCTLTQAKFFWQWGTKRSTQTNLRPQFTLTKLIRTLNWTLSFWIWRRLYWWTQKCLRILRDNQKDLMCSIGAMMELWREPRWSNSMERKPLMIMALIKTACCIWNTDAERASIDPLKHKSLKDIHND